MKEQLEELQSIKLCVANITVTYGMGLEFTTMTNKGVATLMGNIGQWPCFKVLVDESLKNIMNRLKSGEDVENEEFLSTSFGKAMTTYSNCL